jgi:hypothetical protein
MVIRRKNLTITQNFFWIIDIDNVINTWKI